MLSAAEPAKIEEIEDGDEDFDDETLTERLIGLTEMFPPTLANVVSSAVNLSVSAVKGAYSYGRSGMWVFASSATILVLPLMFEMERSQMEEQHQQQQRQILLGPNAAVSGSQPMGAMPNLMRMPNSQ
ncbi:mitochondrial import receptor subunit TOM22 homolog [Tubulanus polymorphus]|uniref:mitochondrial import receptor subunit TOM22 homolog n=1 Tax=Tubulanus polymorphus TaxID=672921 RepID=UPI003DA4E437